jgi:hypothetical protein
MVEVVVAVVGSVVSAEVDDAGADVELEDSAWVQPARTRQAAPATAIQCLGETGRRIVCSTLGGLVPFTARPP